jgi:hypothetical protein
MSTYDGPQWPDLRGEDGAGDGNRTRMTSLEERRSRLAGAPDLGVRGGRGTRC